MNDEFPNVWTDQHLGPIQAWAGGGSTAEFRMAYDLLEKALIQIQEQVGNCVWCGKALHGEFDRQVRVEDDVFTLTQELWTRCPEHGEVWRICVKR